jgi:hypothetical protein
LAILVGFNDNVPLFNQSKLSCRMNDFLFVWKSGLVIYISGRKIRIHAHYSTSSWKILLPLRGTNPIRGAGTRHALWMTHLERRHGSFRT